MICNGDESRRRDLARAKIDNVSRGALAGYRARVREAGFAGARTAAISAYPRWSAPIWDLVLRAIAKARTANVELPTRAELLQYPVYKDDQCSLVRLDDIPEPARSAFIND
ncbi:MAG: hypothetical protein WCV99_18285 [Sterolibacterium sp.]